MARSAALNIIFGADTTQLDRALGNSQKRLRKMSADFTKVGRNMSAAVTAPLLAMGANAVRTFANFEQSMASVKAVSGATDAEFARLSESAKALGRSTVFTASQVADLQLEYSKLGFSAAEIEKTTEATLYLAQATGSDLAQAAEVAGSTLRGFGLDAKELTHVTDVMAKSFSSSALDMSSFQDAMKYVAPVAKAAGVSIEETTAMLGALANSGIKGSQAGTSLRMIFQQLASGGGDVQERLAALAEEGLTLDAAFDEVGRRAQTALLVLGDNAPKVDELTTALKEADGAAKGMADVMNDTTKGAMLRMQSAIEGMNIAIGEALAPIVISMTESISDMANAFTEMTPEGQKFVLVIAGLAAAIGPLLLIVGQLITLKANLGAVYLRVGQKAFVAAGATEALAAANTAAGNTAAIAAGKMRVFSNAMKAIPFAFMVAGITSFVNKVRRAQKEVEDLKQQGLKLKAAFASQEQVFENLETLDSAEILRRINELDALRKTQEEVFGGESASTYFAAGEAGFARMADELIPRSIVQEIAKRTQEIQAQIDEGFVTFGQTAEELATSEVLSRIEADAKKAAKKVADAIAGEEYSAAVAEMQQKLQAALSDIDISQSISPDAIRKQQELADAYENAAQNAAEIGKQDLAQEYIRQARAARENAKSLQANKDLADDLADALADIAQEQFIDENELKKQQALAEAYGDAAKAAFALGQTELANEYKAQAEQAEKAAKALKKVEESLKKQTDAISSLYESVGMNFDAATASVGELLFILENTGTKVGEATEEVTDKVADMGEKIKTILQNTTAETAVALGELIGNFAVGAAGMGDIVGAFGNIIGNLLSTFGKLAIETGVMAIGFGNVIAAVKAALLSLQPAVAIAAGIALVGLGTAVRVGFQKKAEEMEGNVPAFATGGMVTGPTLSLLGDNPSGKEAIIPFERMGQFISMVNGNNTAQQVEVVGRIDGQDILLSTRRSNYDFKRIHG